MAFGQHTKHGVELVSICIPPIFGAITIVVVYFLVREILDRNVALLSAFMTAIISNHIAETYLGVIDHHCFEISLFLGSLLFITFAFIRTKKRYLYAAGAGCIMAGLAYTWIGADIYLGIFLVFAAVQMTFDLKRGKSSKRLLQWFLVPLG